MLKGIGLNMDMLKPFCKCEPHVIYLERTQSIIKYEELKKMCPDCKSKPDFVMYAKDITWQK